MSTSVTSASERGPDHCVHDRHGLNLREARLERRRVHLKQFAHGALKLRSRLYWISAHTSEQIAEIETVITISAARRHPSPPLSFQGPFGITNASIVFSSSASLFSTGCPLGLAYATPTWAVDQRSPDTSPLVGAPRRSARRRQVLRAT